MELPEQYQFLDREKSPRILTEALALYGTQELKGDANSAVILGWAQELGGWIGEWYKEDGVPWCGLFVGVVAKRAGFPFNQKALRARAWLEWGKPVKRPMLGDIIVFERPNGGGHVGLYVGEDDECFHILGGNQHDQVNIARISRKRFMGARRCKWRYKQPKGVRVICIESQDAAISNNEL